MQIANVGLLLIMSIGCRKSTTSSATATSTATSTATATSPATATVTAASPATATVTATALVDLLPADGALGVRRIVLRDEKDRAEAKLEQAGRSIAVVSIERVGSADASRFAVATERVNGLPLLRSNDTAELFADPLRARVVSRELDAASRKAWLLRFDLGGLVVAAQP